MTSLRKFAAANDSATRGPDIRVPVLWTALVVTSVTRMPCAILDISRGGAKLQLPGDVPRYSAITIVSENFGALEGCIVWREGYLAGVKFTDPGASVSLQPFLPTRAERRVANRRVARH